MNVVEHQWPYADGERPKHDDFVGDKAPCNLVMKGGVTSGVVYPATAVHLAKKYCFRAIGGSSVGAVAAVATAAAEYGREMLDERAGFVGLAQLSDDLSKDGVIANLFQPTPETRPLLRALLKFLTLQRKLKQGDESLRRPPPWLVRQIGARSGKRRRMERHEAKDAVVPGWWQWWNVSQRVVSILRTSQTGIAAQHHRVQQRYVVGAALVAIPFILLALSAGVSAVVFASFGIPVSGMVIAGVLVPAALMLVLVLWLLRWAFPFLWAVYDASQILLSDVPKNYYGMCTGLAMDDHAQRATYPDTTGTYAPLTTWLSGWVNELAGKARNDAQPLTFADLIEQQIELKVVTTNLSKTQPFVIPFATNEYLFNEREMRKFFPTEVVNFMVANAHKSRRFAVAQDSPDDRCVLIGADTDDRYYFLPHGAALPIVVAARMSLSFPLLLSAVPLYSIANEVFTKLAAARSQQYTLEEADLQRNWFSDGGICSNFPIHFFDSWFPSIPTFGINLDELPPETFTDPSTDAIQASVLTGEGASTTNAVWLPSSYPEDLPAVRHKEKKDMLAFLWSILDTSLNYRDMMQSRLPSYYDRIVTVRLSETEGGLNLEMPPETIQVIREKGAKAGAKIIEHFNPDHHRWVRLMVLLRELEEQMSEVYQAIAFEQPPANGVKNRVQDLINLELAALALVASGEAERPYPYTRDQEWVANSSTRLDLLEQIITLWGQDKEGFFRKYRPDTSRVRLRITPDL